MVKWRSPMRKGQVSFEKVSEIGSKARKTILKMKKISRHVGHFSTLVNGMEVTLKFDLYKVKRVNFPNDKSSLLEILGTIWPNGISAYGHMLSSKISAVAIWPHGISAYGHMLLCKDFGHILDEFPKKIVSDVLKNLENPRQVVRWAQEDGFTRQKVSNSNPFDALNTVENDADLCTNEENSKLAEKGDNSDVMLDEKFVLVNDDEKTLKKVHDSVNADSDSELDERHFDLRPHMLGPRFTDIEKGIEQYFAKRYADNKYNLKQDYWKVNSGETRDVKMDNDQSHRYPFLISDFYDLHTHDSEEMIKLRDLGANIFTGVPYTEENILALVRKGKHRDHIPRRGRHALVVAKAEAMAKKRKLKELRSVVKSDPRMAELLSQLGSRSDMGSSRGARGGIWSDGSRADDEGGDDDIIGDDDKGH
ncbi:hypothetical protein Tco_1345970 [Tanacetum coccineum]